LNISLNFASFKLEDPATKQLEKQRAARRKRAVPLAPFPNHLNTKGDLL
jgi:hypothetical protein